MGYDIQTGGSNRGIRAEVVDAMVKQIAERTYKFKQALAIVPTSAWKNTFFREDPTVMAGQSGNAFKGIPRGAEFPQAVQKWEEVSVRIIKHGAESNIPWEDIIAGDINIQARTIIKLTEGVVKSVDDDIWNSLTQNNLSDTNLRVQSYAVAASRYWSVASAAIIDDVMAAKTLIGKQNYDTSDLICFINPDDSRYIVKYLIDKGTQFPSIAQESVRNGKIGSIANVTFIESMSVATSYALLVKPKTCATWKELVSLRSTTVEDPYKSLKIRVVEEGVVEVTDPLAICVIKGTATP